MPNWTPWRPFPNPRKGDLLTAPFGPGLYQLRRKSDKRPVLFGRGKNVAHRMTSLLPRPHGAGGRNNSRKREYLRRHLSDIEYRTMPCKTNAQAITEELEVKRSYEHIFNT